MFQMFTTRTDFQTGKNKTTITDTLLKLSNYEIAVFFRTTDFYFSSLKFV